MQTGVLIVHNKCADSSKVLCKHKKLCYNLLSLFIFINLIITSHLKDDYAMWFLKIKMKKIKKISFTFIFFTLLFFANNVFALTPTVSVMADPNNNSMATLNVTGDANSSVILYYYSTNTSGPQVHYIGNTNSNGSLSLSLALSDYNITQNSAIYTTVNGQQSASVAWPFSSSITSSNTLTFSQTSLVTQTGQSSTVTASNNGTYLIYLSSNTNPQVANFLISGNQITVNGLTSGQTTANFCLISSASSNSNCASIYVIVQNSGAQSLTFSQNNTSIISGQNVQINISGGNGFYQVQNNSSSTAISTSLNGPTLTLYANGTTGSTTIMICSTDMNACGTVNASIGTYTTSGTGLSLSSTYPTISTGQTQTININGGYGNYYISSNSNANVIQTYLSTSTVTLYGNTPGNSTVVICSPSGYCGTIVATVVSISGGALALSQNSLSLITGQINSVSISGGTVPYSVIQNDSGIAQYSLSGNALTVTGIASGSSSATICSAGGACVTLTVTVTSSTGGVVYGVQPAFSQNNFSLNTNQTTAVYLSGNGGYYISNNSNKNILSASISGNTIVIFGITVGSANITVCQTGGQCNTLYVTVSNSTTSTVSSIPVTFDKASVDIKVGGVSSINISGGSGTVYYVSYNSNSDSIGTYITGSSLIITGKASGSGTLSVCSSTSVCGSISVTINNVVSNTNSLVSTVKYKFTKPLKFGMTNNEIKELQKKLKEKGVYVGPITRYYGNLTLAAVKKFQKLNGLNQLGSVGPGTRAALNK